MSKSLWVVVGSACQFCGILKQNSNDVISLRRYDNGDVYEGYYKDGMASGHGLRKSGSFKTNDATVYVGEWVNGLRQGYGVMDDIFTGTHTDKSLYPTHIWFFPFLILI